MTTATRYDLPPWVLRCEGTEGRYLVLMEGAVPHACGLDGSDEERYEVATGPEFIKRHWSCVEGCPPMFGPTGYSYLTNSLAEAEAVYERLRAEMFGDAL